MLAFPFVSTGWKSRPSLLGLDGFRAPADDEEICLALRSFCRRQVLDGCQGGVMLLRRQAWIVRCRRTGPQDEGF